MHIFHPINGPYTLFGKQRHGSGANSPERFWQAVEQIYFVMTGLCLQGFFKSFG
jgi:hypothetical protein